MLSNVGHFIASFVILLDFTQLSNCNFSGHLKPLGAQHPAEGTIFTENRITPHTFYKKYVLKQRPVILSGLLNGSLPLKWNDVYLEKHFGNEIVNVDTTKVENRKKSSKALNISAFLHQYKNTSYPLYLIATLPLAMQKEFPLPLCLQCHGFTDRIQDFVLWFSGGNTKSSLHFDNVENLYCQIDGKKEWFLVDPVLGSQHIIIDHPEGQFSSVNVSAVDLLQYPGIRLLPWWKATSYPGDCIYIPVNWWHQVTSKDGRNMAVNVWWAPVISGSSSFSLEQVEKGTVLADFDFHHGEWIRWSLASFLKENGNEVAFSVMRKMVVHEHTGEMLVSIESFRMLDLNSDGILKLEELLPHSSETIHAAVNHVEIGAMNTNGMSDVQRDETLSKEEL